MWPHLLTMIVMIARAPAKIGRDLRRVVGKYGDICAR
jgi:hypothetical protein